MKQLLLIASAMLLVATAQAQLRKALLHFPDANGYKVLKGDFHQHTVFSDGLVWPTTRVEEAYEEDLDIICLSEHIEYRPHLNDLSSRDHNRSFALAKSEAERFGVILIQSTEITREMAPGHLNAINIQDANAFEKFVNQQDTRDASTIVATLEEAKKQGGFIFWNHTAYPTVDNKSTWHPIHEELKNKGLMMGIEIVNGERYEPIAFQWCLDHNLTLFANTDVHSTMAQKRKSDNSKVMTLVLAHEKSQASVMEALRDHRTIGMWNDRLFGREAHVAAVVKAAVDFKLSNVSDHKGLFEIINKSGFPFVFEFLDLDADFSIRKDVPSSVLPNQTSALKATVKGETPTSIKVKVLNVFITPDQNLIVEMPII
ncbi:MAG: hypothetical protein AB7D40_11340 [Bacteroidales bacterium]